MDKAKPSPEATTETTAAPVRECPFCGSELCAVTLEGGVPGVSCSVCGAYTRRLPWREPWIYEGSKSDGSSEKPGTGARFAGDHRAHPVQKDAVGTGSPVSASAASRREQRLAAALEEYDDVLKQAVKELVKRNDKDFFWPDRVSDFVEVGRALRRKHRRLIGGR